MSDKQDIPEVISVQFDPSSSNFGTFDSHGMDGDAKYHSDAKYQALVDKHRRDMQAIKDEVLSNMRKLVPRDKMNATFYIEMELLARMERAINKAFEGEE